MTEYGRASIWRDTVDLDAQAARERADRLEHRARAADEIAARDEYLSLLGIRAGERVLDVGCGSGAVTREIARRVGPTGSVVGLDQSPGLLAIARELARDAGLLDRLEFADGDALRLPFRDDSFDAALAVTVLAHIPHGEDAVPELVRVVRPGGRIGVFDFDGDGVVFSHPDRALTRRIVAAASDATSMNSWLARQMPGLLVQAGAVDVRVRGVLPIETTLDSFYGSFSARCADAALTSGAISEAEHRAWLDAFRAQGAHGPIVAGRVHLFVWGHKPLVR